MKKEYPNNIKSVYTLLGASNHAIEQRQANDFYATEPKAIDLLLENEKFNKNIWECACGNGILSKKLEEYGYNVLSTDLFYRGYGKGGIDFLKQDKPFNGDIITNPPYKYATEFVYKSLELIPKGHKVAMFLKLLFLESKQRKKLFTIYPPKVIYVSSSRLLCAKNGNFAKYSSRAVAFAWYVWEKGFKGDTIVKWIN